jgi:hypothetical protein
MLRTAEGEWIYNPGADFLLFSKGVRPLENDQVFSKLFMEHYTMPIEFGLLVTEAQANGVERQVSPFEAAGPVENERIGGVSYRVLKLRTNAEKTRGFRPMTARALFHSDGRPHSVEFEFVNSPEPEQPVRPNTRIEFSYPALPDKPFADFPQGRRPNLNVNSALGGAEEARSASGAPCLPEWAPGGTVLLNCGPVRTLQDAAGQRVHSQAIPGFAPMPPHITRAGATQVFRDDQGGVWYVGSLGRRSHELPSLALLFPIEPVKTGEPTFWGLKPMGPKSPAIAPEALQVHLVSPKLPGHQFWLLKARSEAIAGRAEKARTAADRALEMARSELGTDEMYRRTFIRWRILPPEDGIVIWPPLVRR